MSGDWWAAAPSTLGSGSGEHDQSDAEGLNDRQSLMQDEQSEGDTDGGFEGHERAECGGGHVPQRDQLAGVRQDGQQQCESGSGQYHPEAQVPGCLWDADYCCGNRGDRDGDRQSAQAFEPVTDLLGEHDIGGPPDRCEGSEQQSGRFERAPPRLGQQDNAEQREGGSGQSPPVAGLDSSDAQWAEEFDGHAGAQRDPLDRGEEGDHLPAGRDPQTE